MSLKRRGWGCGGGVDSDKGDDEGEVVLEVEREGNGLGDEEVGCL